MNTQETVDSRIVDPARLPFAYAEALSAGDADTVLALFHQDATMRTFTGDVLTDQEALRAETVHSIAAQVGATKGATTSADDRQLDVRDLYADWATADGRRAPSAE